MGVDFGGNTSRNRIRLTLVNLIVDMSSFRAFGTETNISVEYHAFRAELTRFGGK